MFSELLQVGPLRVQLVLLSCSNQVHFWLPGQGNQKWTWLEQEKLDAQPTAIKHRAPSILEAI